MFEIIKYIVINLALTLIIEHHVALLLKIESRRDLTNIGLFNFITNVSLSILLITSTLIFKSIIAEIIVIAISEILIVFIEGWFIKKLIDSVNKPYRLSLILNASSFLIGLLISLINVF